MKKILTLFTVLAIVLLAATTFSGVLATTTYYPDQTLTGGFQSGNFADIWDLTAGDIIISFTYDGTGLVDDSGTHAWAELGVKSADTASNFNPYMANRIVGWSHQCSSVLYASQNIALGTVTCSGDEKTLTVEVSVDEPWVILESHLQVAYKLSDIPQTKKGNPIPGQFMTNMEYDPAVTEEIYEIDLKELPNYVAGDPLYIAVHAVVGYMADSMIEYTESAWAGGQDFPGRNWATYMICTPTTIEAAGSGVWLATDYDWTANTFDPDVTPTLDLDDKLILQKKGGIGEGAYDLPSAPPVAGNNHRFWWDRDGVDPWQNPETANTGGVYNIEIHLHATSDTTGTAYMKINGLWQGFETDGNWKTIELTPAGITFTGDMKELFVFYGLYGYGATHTV